MTVWTEWMRSKRYSSDIDTSDYFLGASEQTLSEDSLNTIFCNICGSMSISRTLTNPFLFLTSILSRSAWLLTLSHTSYTWQAPSKPTVICLRPLKGLSSSNRSLFHYWLRCNGPLSDLTGDLRVTTWPPFTHHPSGIIWRRNPWSDSTPPPLPTTLSIHPESLISCRGRGFNALCVMYNFLAAYDTVYWC